MSWHKPLLLIQIRNTLLSEHTPAHSVYDIGVYLVWRRIRIHGQSEIVTGFSPGHIVTGIQVSLIIAASCIYDLRRSISVSCISSSGLPTSTSHHSNCCLYTSHPLPKPANDSIHSLRWTNPLKSFSLEIRPAHSKLPLDVSSQSSTTPCLPHSLRGFSLLCGLKSIVFPSPFRASFLASLLS